MLKFDSWPPEQGKVHFTDDAFEIVFNGFHNSSATVAAAKAVASLLRDNCEFVVGASRIFQDLAEDLPTNGVASRVHWNPQQAFNEAGHSVLGSRVVSTSTGGVQA